ncbi:MAG TPA: helix-turn-helix domain-containing protein [Casimicrobiaceae bacterium]|nr:helix-turn-helix domain-containing protein [Casimicrobiaceae bacterium]
MKEIERRIVRAAEALFAERGFEVTWADIAAATDLSPTMLRRYFRTKSLLVDKVMARLFAGRWRPEWEGFLGNRAAPLERRLIRFFTEYRAHANRTSTRLWTRAGLAGMHASGKYSYHAPLMRRIVLPIVRELRHELDLEPVEQRPLSPAETELVLMLHGSIASASTRTHVFDLPVHGNVAELVAMMVRVWLPGARAELARLHAQPMAATLSALPSQERVAQRPAMVEAEPTTELEIA